MTTQQTTDSLSSQAEVTAARPMPRQHHELTPAEVLSWLPWDATPEQQDSAIQANFKPDPIHWSLRPDTLHLPGQPIGKSYRDISLPQYYKQSFFSGDSLFHPELSGGRLGVAGDPVPYTISGDNLITSILLGCFMLGTVAFSVSRNFFIRQAKTFFYPVRRGVTAITETAYELRFQLFLALQTCLLASIIFFFYLRSQSDDTFILEQYQIIGIFTGIFAAGATVRAAAYTFVDWVFFDMKKNEQWMKAFLFILSSEGVLLFPDVLLLAFFHLSVHSVVIYALIIVGLCKALTFYKTKLIFFGGKDKILQNILYFCALELMPTLALWGVLSMTGNYLKVNF